ncbi:phytoene desaturase family protein [Nocardioides pocheonensis]|uniref:NAD(P)/FAD-dependent oxidoreductase n=1 Tax=Nocardioides pocheonensis TaxID=661485 RepID=A0A3N0GU05_9ACTN|nr:NAD(P)/FAD-dependent oxidoreductase [Nocardioides pocheonensis]RNM15944.1 NAD(P)/FAD-dependent oxidoreductase [Nocardioides pocheonensis]
MARVVVVGGGFGGLASAARLAKLGHDVTLLEASERLGGAIGYVEAEGFRWDSGPTTTLLPAVIRDLFRKSGRAAEKEIDLVPVEPAQRHRFPDGSVLDLPGASRAAQLEAVGSALGEEAGRRWIGYVDDFAEVWEALRKDWFERPWSEEHAGKDARSLLSSRLTLQKLVQRELRDERLRLLATHRAVFDGHDPRNVPAWDGVWCYVEQNFGVWTLPGGMGQLADVLAARLETRGVTVLTGTPAVDLVVESGRVVGVRTPSGSVDADHVVCAIDPRRLPALASYVARTMPAIPPSITHIGVVGEVPDLPAEVVLHGDPTLVLRTTGTAPDGAHAWTVLGRGRLAEDIVVALHRAGINVRDQVEVRVDRSPRELVEEWGGSPLGVLWQGRRTLTHRLGTRTPVDGVYMAGAHTTPGAGLPSVGLSASLVAQIIGAA